MGGFPSIITCSYRNVTKPQNILAFGSLGDLDRFLLLLFENISREEVLHNILENHAALQTLLEFMSSTISEQVEMTHNTSNDVHENLNTSDVENIIRKALVSKYSSKIFSLEGNFVSSESLAIFGHVLEAFPNYLKSEFYYKWRSIETFDSIKAVFNNKDDLLETTLPDLQRSIYDSIYNKADAYILTKTLFNDILPVNDASPSTATFSENNVQRCSIAYQIEVEDEPIERNYSTIIEQTLDHCDPIEVSTLLRSKSWLPIFLAMAETLPIGISLSRVYLRKSRFPVIYVNKYMEKLLGHPRKILVENNNDLLNICSIITLEENNEQIQKNQNENIEILYNSLFDNQSNIVTLTNRRCNGEYFKNIIGIKPIVDESNKCNYVISIHMDAYANNNFGFQESYNFIHQLIETLPRPELYNDLHKIIEL